MSYTEEVYERVVAQNPDEPEFHQAVKEVLDSLKAGYRRKRGEIPQSCPFWSVLLSQRESSLSVFRG